MNEELLSLIQQKCKYIIGVREKNGDIEVQLDNPEDQRAWINYLQSPTTVEGVIKKWIATGGKIE